MNMMKPTVVLGASTNAGRYSYMAVVKLKEYGHPVYPVGIKSGDIDGLSIYTNKPLFNDVHTVTIYLSAKNQIDWMDYILNLKPRRLIFNPGAENDELKVKAEKMHIECLYACTLVMLSIGNY